MIAAEAIVQTSADQPAENEGRAVDRVLLAAIRAVRSGDSEAFETVMARSERGVATLAWRILGDAEEVREAVQETFLRVFRHLHRYDDRRDFFAWLFRIAANVCRDLARRRWKRARRHADLDETHRIPERSHPDAVAAESEELAVLARALDTLPPRERLALILRDVEGLSTREVADALGSREATVRVQVSSARLKIRALVARWRQGGG